MNKDNIASPTRLSLRPAIEADAPLLIFILHTAFEEYRYKLDPPAGVFHETSDTIRQPLYLTPNFSKKMKLIPQQQN